MSNCRWTGIFSKGIKFIQFSLPCICFGECVKEGKTIFFFKITHAQRDCMVMMMIIFFLLLMGFQFHSRWLKELGTKLRNTVVLNIKFIIKIKIHFYE